MVWVTKEELIKILKDKIPEDGCEIRIDIKTDNNLVYDPTSIFPQAMIQNEYLEIFLYVEADKALEVRK